MHEIYAYLKIRKFEGSVHAFNSGDHLYRESYLHCGIRLPSVRNFNLWAKWCFWQLRISDLAAYRCATIGIEGRIQPVPGTAIRFETDHLGRMGESPLIHNLSSTTVLEIDQTISAIQNLLYRLNHTAGWPASHRLYWQIHLPVGLQCSAGAGTDPQEIFLNLGLTFRGYRFAAAAAVHPQLPVTIGISISHD